MVVYKDCAVLSEVLLQVAAVAVGAAVLVDSHPVELVAAAMEVRSPLQSGQAEAFPWVEAVSSLQMVQEMVVSSLQAVQAA